MRIIHRKNKQFQNNLAVQTAVDYVRSVWDIKNRPFSEADFFRICELENITLIDTAESFQAMKNFPQVTGWYAACRGRRFIWLKSFSFKKLNLQTGLHELGHHFLNHKGISFATGEIDAEQERQADLFASLFLAGGAF